MYRVIWNTGGDFVNEAGYYRNAAPVDNRPTEIDADRYEVSTGPEHSYFVTITFYKEDRPVATLFQTPVAIITIANIPQ